jgi:hypothetical protein
MEGCGHGIIDRNRSSICTRCWQLRPEEVAAILTAEGFWDKPAYLPTYDGVFVENVLDKGLLTSLRRKVAQDKQWHEKGDSFIWEKDRVSAKLG